jgi:ribonuclease HI
MSITKNSPIVIFTDGSCNPTLGIGGWASILFIEEKKIILSGTEEQTTHQRMELQAVLKAFEYLAQAHAQMQAVELHTDSQYVTGIFHRRMKLKRTEFRTSNNLLVRNVELVKMLVQFIEGMNVRFIKVKAHQRKDAPNSNREVDKLARKMVRERSTVISVKRNTTVA